MAQLCDNFLINCHWCHAKVIYLMKKEDSRLRGSLLMCWNLAKGYQTVVFKEYKRSQSLPTMCFTLELVIWFDLFWQTMLVFPFCCNKSLSNFPFVKKLKASFIGCKQSIDLNLATNNDTSNAHIVQQTPSALHIEIQKSNNSMHNVPIFIKINVQSMWIIVLHWQSVGSLCQQKPKYMFWS